MGCLIICITVGDDMALRAGAEPIIINRQETIKTWSGKVKIFSENNVVLKPGSRIKTKVRSNKGCASTRVYCYNKVLDTTMTIETKARTPFLLPSPRFSFGIFRYLTMAEESWFDVMITAARSEENSVKGVNCLKYFNFHESIFKRSNLFSKSVPGVSRKDSILVNLVQLERTRPVQIRIKILTRSTLLKVNLKPKTIIDLEWTSVLSLFRDISGKTISLPGVLKSITLETLSYVKNNTINVHWIPDLFSRNFDQSYKRFCHKDLLTKTKSSYCLNYTSIQNSYIFLWNFTQYLKCYLVLHPKWENISSLFEDVGFKISKGNKCPTQQPKGKVIKSWKEAFNLCKSIGGTLPLLRNRDELEEIIAFLKLSKDMPPVEGLYIGIHGSFRSQVKDSGQYKGVKNFTSVTC